MGKAIFEYLPYFTAFDGDYLFLIIRSISIIWNL